MKTCIKCGLYLPLSGFYRAAHMKDGHTNKCRDCSKADARQWRRDNAQRARAYDKARPTRATAEGRKRYREANRERYKAHNAVSNAVRDGRLDKAPCVICGSEQVHGHHDNYARPLDVVWLCAVHHAERHREAIA